MSEQTLAEHCAEFPSPVSSQSYTPTQLHITSPADVEAAVAPDASPIEDLDSVADHGVVHVPAGYIQRRRRSVLMRSSLTPERNSAQANTVEPINITDDSDEDVHNSTAASSSANPPGAILPAQRPADFTCIASGCCFGPGGRPSSVTSAMSSCPFCNARRFEEVVAIQEGARLTRALMAMSPDVLEQAFSRVRRFGGAALVARFRAAVQRNRLRRNPNRPKRGPRGPYKKK